MNRECVRTRRAAEAMAARMGFYIHAAVFAAVLIILTLVNLFAGPEELWVQWVFLGWGLGVMLHAVLVFGRWPATVKTWQMRKIRRLREQI